MALQPLDVKLAARPAGERDAAVVLDIDETVLLTLEFNLWTRENRRAFSVDSWNEWVDSREDPLPALPGREASHAAGTP